MIRKAIGLIFIVISFFGILYFKDYKGSVIPYPTLWFIGFVLLEILGSYMVYLSFYKRRKIMVDNFNSETEKFKSSAEKVELEFDKCEFKNGSFSQETEDPKFTSVKHLVPNSQAYAIDTTITANIVRSYLIYINDQTAYRYISQAFPFDETTLKFYVINKKITLYIDRYNREKYFFELKE